MDGINVQDIAPGQQIEIDLFRPEDAEGVAALFHAVYGEQYPHRVYYDPRALRAENAAGRIISSVARTAGGDVVGHSALFQTAPFPSLYESGAGLVLPSYRHTSGILTRLLAHGFEVAPRRFGVEAIFGDAVLNHPFTQKAALNQGAMFTGLQVDLMPAAPYAKEGSSSGRVSSLVTINLCKPRPQRVHLPAPYQDVLGGIYRELADQRDLVVSDQPVPPGSPSRVETRFFGFAQVARMQATEIGEDFAERFALAEKTATDQGALVLQAWLDLSIPWLGWAVDCLRARRYFLGGVVPRWFDHDALFVQKILHRPHWEGIVMELTRGQELLDLVREDWERSLG